MIVDGIVTHVRTSISFRADSWTYTRLLLVVLSQGLGWLYLQESWWGDLLTVFLIINLAQLVYGALHWTYSTTVVTGCASFLFSVPHRLKTGSVIPVNVDLRLACSL